MLVSWIGKFLSIFSQFFKLVILTKIFRGLTYDQIFFLSVLKSGNEFNAHNSLKHQLSTET